MPLYKRKPFPLMELPKDLDPLELVFQIRFTKEIFSDYQEYLNRLNLYRQRVWTCKVSGKTNFTYEEALVSEQRATEKVQQIPKESMPSILHMVQYSTLRLKDLVIAISTKLQEPLLEGVELYGKKDRSMCLCRVLKVIKHSESTHYEVGWLDKNRSVTDTSIVTVNELIRKKLPFSRIVLKSFIRESTWRSMPWVVHEKLARKHGLSTEPPEELIGKIASQNGCLSREKDYIKAKARRKNNLDAENDKSSKKRKAKHLNSEGSEAIKNKAKKEDNSKEEPVKYPIDDLLVKPGTDDPVFTECPSPSRNFIVPMDCVGDLIMVWDFCSSFSRLLNLWPFSLEDFEKAISHKDSDLLLIFELHAAILRLLIKDEGEYFITIQKKRWKPKITLVKWSEYLCDFLEMKDRPEISSHMSTIKRGHYGLLDVHVKLYILKELVSEALTTVAIREQLDEYIQKQQVPAATKREEMRKKKGERHVKKEESDAKKTNQTHDLDNGDVNLHTLKIGSKHGKSGDTLCNGTEKFLQANGKHFPDNGKGRHGVANSKTAKRLRRGWRDNYDNVKNPSAKEGKKVQLGRKDKDEDSLEKTTEEHHKEHHEGEIEKRFIRTNALGKDRNYNRYWFFRRDGRLFVESSDSKQWGYYSTKEELDLFMGSLNPKGERERALKRQLERQYPRISLALQKRTRHVSHKNLLEEAVLRRSNRVRAQPRGGPAKSFLRYVNKWKKH